MQRRIYIDRFTVLPDERRVLDGTEPVALGGRGFDLLMCLIEHHDLVVPRQALMDRVWPGLVVEDTNLSVQVSTLRKLLGSDAIRTVAGRGYRLAMPVWQAPEAEPPSLSAAAPAALPVRPDGLFDLLQRERPSIAVMPFDDLSAEPDPHAFIDGLVEDIITELSRFHDLLVIRGNSSVSDRGRAADMRMAPRETGARYLLQGSLRRADDRIRLTAQLIDANNSQPLWSERFDRQLAHVFKLQAELSHTIVGMVAPQIETASLRRARQAVDPSTSELARLAEEACRVALMTSDRGLIDERLRRVDLALENDPECSAAWRARSFGRWLQVYLYPGDDAADQVADGLASAGRAIELDGADHLAHFRLGQLLACSGRHAEALLAWRQAHALNPNHVLTISVLAAREAMDGHGEQALHLARKALRMSLLDPQRYVHLATLSTVHFCAGRHAEAAEWAWSSLGEAPHNSLGQLALVLALVGVGDIAGARRAFEQLRSLAPQMVAQRLAGLGRASPPGPMRDHFLSYLRIAASLDDPADNAALP